MQTILTHMMGKVNMISPTYPRWYMPGVTITLLIMHIYMDARMMNGTKK